MARGALWLATRVCVRSCSCVMPCTHPHTSSLLTFAAACLPASMGQRTAMLAAADSFEIGDYAGRKAIDRRCEAKLPRTPVSKDAEPRAAPCRRPAHSEACGPLHSKEVDLQASASGKRWLQGMRAAAVSKAQVKSTRARRKLRHQQERAAVMEERGQRHLDSGGECGAKQSAGSAARAAAR